MDMRQYTWTRCKSAVLLYYIVSLLSLGWTQTVSSSVTCYTTPSSGEVHALQALYDSTNGPQWTWQPLSAGKVWDFTVASPNPCNKWQGIDCKQTTSTTPCYVYSVVLTTYNLQGTLPPTIGNLLHLATLQLSNSPQLTGHIPATVGNLTALVNLDLYSNALSGTFPSSITSLPHLQHLYLFKNQLQGSLPNSLGKLRGLTTFEINNNQLTGTVPPSITQLVNLQRLYLSNNHMHGKIPNDIGNLTNLIILDFRSNAFTGTIPTSITKLKKLQNLYLYANQLHGSIPEAIGDLTSLISLDLDTNMLSGSIPSSITQITALQNILLLKNNLHGSVPNDINKLTNLLIFSIYQNQLTGTIPNSITSLSRLQYMYWHNNLFHGDIPEGIGNMTGLLRLDLTENLFSGTIPAAITLMNGLQNCLLFENNFHGSIPENIGNMTSLNDLDFGSNLLTGTIPSSITSLTNLHDFSLYENSIHGSIPEDIGKLQNLTIIGLYDNQLTGSIPSSISTLIRLVDLLLDDNQFHGTIRNLFSASLKLQRLRLSNNYLTGTIQISSPLNLEDFDVSANGCYGDVMWMEMIPLANSSVISKNMFSGVLPSYSQLAPYLTYFQASENFFSGGISNLFHPNVQTNLQLIDLSINSLTGSIPESIFQLVNLTYVILAQNCFTGSIPSTVCYPKNTLEVLVLDGLHQTSSCQQRLFPAIPEIDTLANMHAIQGSIPGCLFGEMQQLKILHLSGNGLTGSLPDSYQELNQYLDQMSLSHNELTGSIPLVFQRHGFTNLDLSFNQLTGKLSHQINPVGYDALANQGNASSTGLKLNNNRLSGNIPSAVLPLQYIDILAGNMFECNGEDRQSTLPQHDDEFNTYMCGSDETNNAMIVYVVVIASMVMVALLAWWLKLAQLDWTFMDMSSTDIKAMNCIFQYLLNLQRYVLLLTCTAVVIFMVSYGILGMFFSTYEYKYVWTISIAYLSGIAPGACLLVIMILVLLGIDFGHKYLMESRFLDNMPEVVFPKRAMSKAEHKNHWKLRSKLFFCLLLNIVVVMTVNASYVSIILSGISTSEQSLITIAISLFKDGWRWFIMSSLKWKVTRDLETMWGPDSVSSWLLFVCLFNNILAPCIATAMVNSNCFYYAIVPADRVVYNNSGDEITYCELTYRIGGCAIYESIDISTSYQPPFTYAYQCTSTLLALFAPVWIYMFLFGGIITPLVNMAAFALHAKDKKEGKTLKLQSLSIFSWILLIIQGKLSSTRLLSKFDHRKEVLLLCSNLAIMLSFGVLFPPIAVAGFIAMTVHLLQLKLLLADVIRTCKTFLVNDKEEAREDSSRSMAEIIMAETEESCSKFPHTYIYTMRTVVIYVSMVWAVFLWDIVGGEVGLVQSIWVFLLMLLTGILLRFQDLLKSAWLRIMSIKQLPETVTASDRHSVLEIGSIRTSNNTSSITEGDNPMHDKL